MTASLPIELWMKVFECLPATDLCCTVPLLCWDLRYAAQDESLWRKLYSNHFNIVIMAHRDENNTDDWRYRYMDRRKMVLAKGLVEFYELLKTLLRDPYAFGRNNVMNMYTTVFHFCISNFRVRDYGTNHLGLYQMLVDTCIGYLDEVYSEAALISPGEELLEYYIETWDRYQNVLKRFNSIFAYFQRDYRTRQDRESDLFERMVNAYIANKNWKSNVVLGITPMMTVNWLKRFFNPLQQSLIQSVESCNTPTTQKAITSLLSLVELSQCQTFPQEMYRELMGQLRFILKNGKDNGEDGEDHDGDDGDVVMEERVDGIVTWMPPSAGVAVQ